MIFLKTLISLIFGGTGTLQLVLGTVEIAGYWMLLKKCGAKGWSALIPGWRYVVIGRCCGNEPEGLLTGLVWVINTIFVAGSGSLPRESLGYLLFTWGGLTASLFLLICEIRLFSGLIELFGEKKKWMFLWLFLDFIPAVLWGFKDKYQPSIRLDDLERQEESFFSGTKASVLEDGLTVNLEERSARSALRKKVLLRDIHLDIEPGSMVLLLGGSGSGKTTLINAINGYEPAKAEIMLNGQNVYENYDMIKFNIGFVPQSDLMRPQDTVEHTLRDAAHLRLPTELSHQAVENRVDTVMDIFGLTPVKNSRVRKLSGGQRKRLSIAMEFLSNPDLFILDEPDSGLDGVIARELMEQLRAIADQGKIVLVVTHTPDRCLDLFDHVIVLAKDAARTGRLVFYGTVDDAREFFHREKMEDIIRCINRPEEGGEGMADDLLRKFAEVQNA